MESINLEVTLINEILGYLSGKPYAEVADLITKVHQAAQAQPQPETKKPATAKKK